MDTKKKIEKPRRDQMTIKEALTQIEDMSLEEFMQVPGATREMFCFYTGDRDESCYCWDCEYRYDCDCPVSSFPPLRT